MTTSPTTRQVVRIVLAVAGTAGGLYLACIALLGAIVFLGLVAVPPIARQIEAGVHRLPAGIAKLREDPTFRRYDNKYKITAKLATEARVGAFDLVPLVGATIAAIIVGIVTLFYGFPTDTIIWAIVGGKPRGPTDD